MSKHDIYIKNGSHTQLWSHNTTVQLNYLLPKNTLVFIVAQHKVTHVFVVIWISSPLHWQHCECIVMNYISYTMFTKNNRNNNSDDNEKLFLAHILTPQYLRIILRYCKRESHVITFLDLINKSC